MFPGVGTRRPTAAESLPEGGIRGGAMSQENVEIVRKPLRVRERSSRTLDQRLALRFPRLFDAYARVIVGRLPPTSRVRQAAVWRGSRLGMEAFNRRDLDAALLYATPDFEYHPPREFVDMGLLEPCYRGRAGFHTYVSDWSEVFGADLRTEPVELIDLGDRIVLLADLPARAQASGVPLTGKIATISVLKHGKAIRVKAYWDHAQALEAVGLSE
jgi:ketosteroid isomerase-like protein